MYVNGMGFRVIERVKGVHHTRIINWVKQVGELLPNAYDSEIINTLSEMYIFDNRHSDIYTEVSLLSIVHA